MLTNAPVTPTLPASDIERAKKFYNETLGLEVDREGPEGVFFKTGSGSILVYPSGSAGTNQATAAGFTVTDLDAEMTELRAKGVEFEEYDFPGLKTVNGVADFGGMRGAWFKDTEGNIIALDEH
jgi:predicted enzyme related to lactoylglutathione lyase